MKLISVFVPGHAKTKGSMRHVGGGNMVESVVGSTQWKRIMTGLIKAQWRREFAEPFTGACSVLADAYLDRTEEEIIKQGAGDSDKLQRNVLDALQEAGVYVNDSQVVDQRLRKWGIRSYPLAPNPGIMINVYSGRLP